MKKNMIIAIAAAMLTAGTTVCHAQTTQKQQFTGGMMKQMEFMMKNLKYPKEAENEGASGTVRVHFIVEKDGSLTDVKVPESVHKALDAEAIRLVKAMPKWTPAQLKGKAVRSKMMLAIPFRLK